MQLKTGNLLILLVSALGLEPRTYCLKVSRYGLSHAITPYQTDDECSRKALNLGRFDLTVPITP
jgi:hypothetical protein